MSNIKSLSDLKKKENNSLGGSNGNNNNNNGNGFGNIIPNMFNSFSQESKLIKHIRSDKEFQEELRKSNNKLVVVDFSASWCGPCKFISPLFSQYSETYTNAIFLKIDVDECPEIAQQCNIHAMPTFQFYKNGKKIDEFSGADQRKLKEYIEKYYSKSSDSSNMSGGYVLGGGSQSMKSPHSLVSTNDSNKKEISANDLLNMENHPFLPTLIEMGIPKESAIKTLYATKGNNNIEDVLNWYFNNPIEDPAVKSENLLSITEENNNKSQQSSFITEEDKNLMDVEKQNEINTIHNALCNSCLKKIIGIRYKCDQCSDYDLCQNCFENKTHNPEHTFTPYVKDIENPEKKPLTPEEIEEQKKRIQQKLQKLREEKLSKEFQREIEREKIRRKSGQEAIEAKKKWEEAQKQRDILLKKKEKEEEEKARKAIKEKLEQDKRERQAKKKNEQQIIFQSKINNPIPKKEYNETLIQFRLPDGNTIKSSFNPKDTIRIVHNYLSNVIGTSTFSLMTTFPKKIYSPNNFEIDNITLENAELVPSGTFIVTK